MTAPTTADSSVTLKAVRPAAKANSKVKKFLTTLMRSLASAHA
jgi:hypothetical protein